MQFVTTYVQGMYEHFCSKESSTFVRPLYMKDQQHTNRHMRSILINWLVEAHLKFKLVPETLYLVVNIFDRYLLAHAVAYQIEIPCANHSSELIITCKLKYCV